MVAILFFILFLRLGPWPVRAVLFNIQEHRSFNPFPDPSLGIPGVVMKFILSRAALSCMLDVFREIEQYATPTASEYDPSGSRFACEMGVTKTSGGQGWAAVFAAYGWNPDLSDEEILEKLP